KRPVALKILRSDETEFAKEEIKKLECDLLNLIVRSNYSGLEIEKVRIIIRQHGKLLRINQLKSQSMMEVLMEKYEWNHNN
ncbi:hypothetical protein PENTCL1PPCAC_12297, partial [Pristionchus entomophagus]